MKLLTKEEEREHYNETLKGGTLGGFAGLGLGLAGIYIAGARYHFVRDLTLPLKAFFVTSAGTFGGIVSADHYSRAYEARRNPKQMQYQEREEERRQAEVAGLSWTQRALQWGKEERYKIVGASWLASMAGAFALVNRNKYLTGQQKIVQARVYAQFLTLGVLIASAAFEISDSKNQEGRWETVRYVDPNDPEHKRMLEKQVRRDSGGDKKEDRDNKDMWKDMVDAEEQRLKEKEEEDASYRKSQEKKSQKSEKQSKDNKKDQKDKKDSGKDEKKDDSKNEKKK